MAAHQAPPSLGFSRQEHWRFLEKKKVAISFSNARKWKVKAKPLSHVWLLATPWTAAYQAPLSMGFSRQEYWSGVPLPSPSYILLQFKGCPLVTQISTVSFLSSTQHTNPHMKLSVYSFLWDNKLKTGNKHISSLSVCQVQCKRLFSQQIFSKQLPYAIHCTRRSTQRE